MQAQIYAVPVGVINGQMITTIEVFVPDLLLVVNPANSSVFESVEEAEEKYSELEAIKEFEIEKLDESLFNNLSDIVKQRAEVEGDIFIKLDKTIRDAINEFKNTPKIHIPSAGEVSMLSGGMEEDDGGGRIILDGF
jgi:hypothetical protein